MCNSEIMNVCYEANVKHEKHKSEGLVVDVEAKPEKHAIFMYVFMYVFIMYVFMYVCMYVFMYVCIYVCMYLCMYVFMYVYACVCVLVRVYGAGGSGHQEAVLHCALRHTGLLSQDLGEAGPRGVGEGGETCANT